MLVLGIETSCDDSAVAIVEVNSTTGSNRVLASLRHTQIEEHRAFGGTVPEIAARAHLEYLLPTLDAVLKVSNKRLEDIELIAVTAKPGLFGSLVIGISTAKTLAQVIKKPYVEVNHLHGHLLSYFCNKDLDIRDSLELLGLIVSGGHTELVRFTSDKEYLVISRTRDDAVGECFDKIGRLIGLQFPAGPELSKLALKGNRDRIKWPQTKLGDSLDFSFSGIKTAVLRYLQKVTCSDINEIPVPSKIDEQLTFDIAASIEDYLTNQLVDKLIKATKVEDYKSIVLGGGVSANNLLRTKLAPIGVMIPELEYTTDNAAMIALAGAFID